MQVLRWIILVAMAASSCEAIKVSTRVGPTAGSENSGQSDKTTSTRTSAQTTNTATAANAKTVGTPEFSPAGNTYMATQSVTITSTTAAAVIYYTTDGSEPTTGSLLYSGAVTVASSLTLKALAVKANLADSVVGSAVYVIDTTAPTITYTSISPPSPNWSRTPTVTMTLSEDATVTLYGDSGCTIAVSSATSLTAGTGRTVSTNNLNLISKTTLYAKGVDAAGNASSCTSLVAYTNIVRFQDPNPSANNGFGADIVELSNGNIVITSPNADMSGVSDSGAVYLFNGATGALISTLYGTTASDLVGARGVTPLSNGNFVVISPWWNCSVAAGCAAASTEVGAVTWASGITGIEGEVDASNSLIGSSLNDYVGNSGVVALSNGAYVVGSQDWNCIVTAGCAGSVADVGAATWASGTAGISGPVNTSNSLIGSSLGDAIAYGGITALTNGNYVVNSHKWSSSRGAATWGSGTTGITGVVSSANSLVGSTAFDQVGYPEITALSNGNYLVSSTWWTCTLALGCSGTIANVGAVTWSSGSSGITGAVRVSNSLVGSTANDSVGGTSAISKLTNGNYVVGSRWWNCTVAAGCPSSTADVGAVTWGSATTGVSGFITTSNSLVGSSVNDYLSYGAPLSNGNYVVQSSGWDCTVAAGCSGAIADVGAVTWGSGTAGVSGFITTTNSLVGSTSGDGISSMGIVPLSNGNYVVLSPSWDCSVAAGCSGAVANVGAATWRSGAATSAGTVSTANSVIGTTAGDRIGFGSGLALNNGNYVVFSPYWDCTVAAGCAATIADVGAATWRSGSSANPATINSTNSLVGSTASDQVGDVTFGAGAAVALSNGNYVMENPSWDCTVGAGCAGAIANVGAVTWGSGTAGVAGAISMSNSLVGSTASDIIGFTSFSAALVGLTNGNYIVGSPNWDCQIGAGCAGTVVDVGAVTWGSGTTGVVGGISTSNSLVGSAASDKLGSDTIMQLATSSNYLVQSSFWNSGEQMIYVAPVLSVFLVRYSKFAEFT